MANRNPELGPVTYKLPTLDPKVVPVIKRRYPSFTAEAFDSHYQVSYFGHGYGDIVRVDGQWRTLVYYPGGKYRCTGGVHKKYKDAISAVSELLVKYEVAA